QPVSVAGRRLAKDDERWLWPEYARITSELRPAIVVIENVPGLYSAGLRDVLSDLANLGFDAEWTRASAGEAGANHLRERLFLVATDPQRVGVRVEPGWLRRTFESERASFDRVVVEEGFSSDTDEMRRLEQSRQIAEKRGWAEHCGWSLGPIARVDDG